MRRHALFYRSQRQHRLARRIVVRQPLVARMARRQLLMQELGLTTGATERAGIQREHNFNRMPQIVLHLSRSVFRPPLVERLQEVLSDQGPLVDHLFERQEEERPEQEVITSVPTIENVEDGSVMAVNSFMRDELEGVPGQQAVHEDQSLDTQVQDPANVLPVLELPATESAEARAPEVSPVEHEDVGHPLEVIEPVEPVLQQRQEGTDNLVPPVEQVKAKRTRGRIEERPTGSGQAPVSPPTPSSNVARRSEPAKVAPEAPVVNEEDDLFAPRDTDRSPQAWIARLNSATSAPREEIVPPTEATETGGREQPGSAQRMVFNDKSQGERLTPAYHDPGRQAQRVMIGVPLIGEDLSAPTQGTSQGYPSHTRLGAAGRWYFVANEASGVYGRDTPRGYPAPWTMPQLSGNNLVYGRDTPRGYPAPTPLSQQARRFLQPLVGIDPTSVRVYRDAAAEGLTDAYQADAITVGDDVAIAAGHPDDTPETLGLLAHELTHVVRLREPHFIPPIARARSSLPAGSTSIYDSMTPGQPSVPSDEETLARRVESRITRAARQQVDQATLVPVVPARVEPPAGTRSPAAVPGSEHDSWGGLPAPWEPLPDWLVSMPVTKEDSAGATIVPPQPSQVAHGTASSQSSMKEVSGTYAGGGTWNGGTLGDAGVQRAGVERSLGEDEVHEEQPPAAIAQTPQPDLDALARQVYAHLKRRLESERRRES